MNPKVSIVVPIFNMEAYLKRCLESFFSQKMQDLEIIAVNDGSTDGSLHILEEYKKKDPRLRIINQVNQGVSSARNTGIQACGGEYIGFVDPDDWINEDMYEVMYHTAEKNHADIVMCSYVREFGAFSKEKHFNLPEKVKYVEDEIRSNVLRRLIGPIGKEIANPELLDAWGTVWCKLYRNSLIKENNIMFVDLHLIGTNEDSLFNIEAFFQAKSFVFLNIPLYHYWKANSTSITSHYKPKLIEQWFVLYKMMDDFLLRTNLRDAYLTAFNNRICLNILGLGLNTISKSNQKPTLLKIKELHTILNQSRIREAFRQFDSKGLPITWKAFYTCGRTRFAVGYYTFLMMINLLRRAKI